MLKTVRIKSFMAICLATVLLAGCSNSQTNKFFNSDDYTDSTAVTEGTTETSVDEPSSSESDIHSSESDIPSSENTSSETPDEEKDYPEVKTFFNSGTHPDIFYIKSTGFDYTRKTDEVKAIITEGYITEGDKITGCYMRIYPMIGFSGEVFDSYTDGLYSFADFERQDDDSFLLNITGEVLENIQKLSASTSMAMLAGKAVSEGLTILDEKGNLYTVRNGNLMLVTEDGLANIPSAESTTSEAESTTSEAESDKNEAEGTTSEAESEDISNQD